MRASYQPDVVTRMMHEALARPPHAIYRMARMVKGGPICPAAIFWAETTEEPGNPENKMDGTRSRFIVGYVSFEVVAPERIYGGGGASWATIDRERYDREMALLSEDWARDRYNPRLSPFKKVKPKAVPLPF